MSNYKNFRNSVRTKTAKFHFVMPNGVVLFTTKKEYHKEMTAYNRA